MPDSVSVSRVIAAEPQAIFDVLADPAMHPVIDGSGSVRRSRRGNPERLAPGAKFGMSMVLGLPYRIRNTVVEFEEPRRIAWRHLGRHRWRYELEAVDGGTKVTETFDWGPALAPSFYYERAFAGRNRRGMEQTLERLDRYVTTGSADPA